MVAFLKLTVHTSLWVTLTGNSTKLNTGPMRLPRSGADGRFATTSMFKKTGNFS
jgi:hypothetical protein